MKTGLSIQYGIYTGAALIAYFLVMKLAGLEHVFELRLLNFIILFTGVFMLHRYMYRTSGEPHGYLNGLLVGMRMSAVAILLLIAFLSVYTSSIDRDFLKILQNQNLWGGDLSLFQSAVAIAFEGMASAVIICYASMQYFKKWANDQNELADD